MFLNSLSKKSKPLFLELAIKAAEANGVVELVEKNMLKVYAIEMGIEPVYSTNNDTDIILNRLLEVSTKKELKIVLFEILGILVSDSEFDNEEMTFFQNIGTMFDISPEICEEMISLLKDYKDLFNKIVNVVML